MTQCESKVLYLIIKNTSTKGHMNMLRAQPHSASRTWAAQVAQEGQLCESVDLYIFNSVKRLCEMSNTFRT